MPNSKKKVNLHTIISIDLHVLKYNCKDVAIFKKELDISNLNKKTTLRLLLKVVKSIKTGDYHVRS